MCSLISGVSYETHKYCRKVFIKNITANIIHFVLFAHTYTHTHRTIQPGHFTCEKTRFNALYFFHNFVSFSMECNNLVQFSAALCRTVCFFLSLSVVPLFCFFCIRSKVNIFLVVAISFDYNSLLFSFVRFLLLIQMPYATQPIQVHI